jgi:hypothetical protein
MKSSKKTHFRLFDYDELSLRLRDFRDLPETIFLHQRRCCNIIPPFYIPEYTHQVQKYELMVSNALLAA